MNKAFSSKNRSGVALVIVLLFVVLVTALVVGFFSRAVSNRQLSKSSSAQSNVEQLASSATDIIVGDLKQEIVTGSNPTTVGSGGNTTTLYVPKAAANMMPQPSGTPAAGATPIPNLIRRSVRSDAIASPGQSSRASAASSADPSANGRSISAARWNAHFLVPQLNAGNATDTTPVASFVAPDWVYVTGKGPEVIAVPSTSVVGRYAFAVYDEGGLLDINLAGYPQAATGLTGTLTPAYKSSPVFADLTQLGVAAADVDKIVGWRNYASVKPTGTFPNFTLAAAAATDFNQMAATNSTGFLKTATTVWNNRTDQSFLSRQQLLDLRAAVGFNPAALQYLTTFSRTLEQPSYIPALFTDPAAPKVLQDGTTNLGGNNACGGDQIINPSFLEKRVAAAFDRNQPDPADPTKFVQANPGEPLVMKRFALNRLAWITYKGPSATLMSDPIVTALKSQGVPESLLLQGTAANIYKYFGVTWDAASHRWVYDHSSVAPPAPAPVPSGIISTLASVTGREPDFFELLKAAITVGSLGKHGSLPRTVASADPQRTFDQQMPLATQIQYRRDIMVDMQVFAIGANIIDQSDPDGYPTRLLVYNPLASSPATREITGTENLPYLYRIRNGAIRLQEPAATLTSTADNSDVSKTGSVAQVLFPELWNPHDQNSPSSGVDPSSGAAISGLAPTSFRVAAVSASPDDNSGSPDPVNFAVLARKWDNTSYPRPEDYAMTVPNTVISPPRSLTDGASFGNNWNPAITFSVPASATSLFREPTMLALPGLPAAANPQVSAWPTEVSSYVSGGGLQTTAVGNGAITDVKYNGGNSAVGQAIYNAPSAFSSSRNYLGIYLGSGPLKLYNSSITDPANTFATSWITAYISTLRGSALTIRLQYQDPLGSSQWVTYDEKVPPVLAPTANSGNSTYYYLPYAADLMMGWVNRSSRGGIVDSIDPRTARFGMIQNDSTNNKGAWDSLTSSSTLQLLTDRSDSGDSGRGFQQQTFGRGMPQSPSNLNLSSDLPGSPAPGWFGNSGGWASTKVIPTLLVQNDPTLVHPNGFQMYYADPDGVVRRATGGYMPSLTTDIGNSLKTANNQSRPIILNRPFRSVAELGHVFRDTPWKNLDFFTPESGDAALLDVFTINETEDTNGLAAGKVNLNTRQQPVIKAILMGAFKDEQKNQSVPGALSPLSVAEADSIATAFIAWNKANPVQNIADVVGRWSGNKTMVSGAAGGYGIDGKASYSGFTKQLASSNFSTNATESWNIQRMHESAIRALTAAGQCRVWNLMVDVVAQAGRFPASADSLDKFIVEGEQRYWVHIAIDRLTGQVLDKQVEAVRE